ncbi:MAG: zinc ribbon domain-containing protein [Candidatus Thermoplasmatota archaeon]
MHCANCGFPLEPNARFCPRCSSVSLAISQREPSLERIALAIERNATATENIYNLMLAAAAVTVIVGILLGIVVTGGWP